MITSIMKSLSNHFSFFDDKYKVSIAFAITLSTITKTSLFSEIDTYEILLFNFFCFTSMLFIFFTLANKLTIYLAYRKMTSNLEKELSKTIILLFRTKINSKQKQEQGKEKTSISNNIKLSILIILGIISNYIFFVEYYSLSDLEKIFTYSMMVTTNIFMMLSVVITIEFKKTKKLIIEDRNENITEVI